MPNTDNANNFTQRQDTEPNSTETGDNSQQVNHSTTEEQSSQTPRPRWERLSRLIYEENIRLCRDTQSLCCLNNLDLTNQQMALCGSGIFASIHGTIGAACLTLGVAFKSVPCCSITCFTVGSSFCVAAFGQFGGVVYVANQNDPPTIIDQYGQPITSEQAQQFFSQLADNMESLPEENGQPITQQQVHQLISELFSNMSPPAIENNQTITPELADQLRDQLSQSLQTIPEQHQLPVGLEHARQIISRLSGAIEAIPDTQVIQPNTPRSRPNTPNNNPETASRHGRLVYSHTDRQSNHTDRQSHNPSGDNNTATASHANISNPMHQRLTGTPLALYSDRSSINGQPGTPGEPGTQEAAQQTGPP